MKTLHFLLIIFSVVSLSLFSCGGDNTQKADATETSEPETTNTENTEQPKNMQEAMKMAQKQIENLQGENKNVTPVNFRKLKELLPERLLDLPRTKHTGESAGAMGMKVSSAEAEYRDGDKRLTVKLIDAGGIGMATMGMAAWTTIDLDREDDNGFERTSNWKNFKAYEKCRTADKFCTLKLYSEQGIMAELDGYGYSISDLKGAAQKLEINSIPGMRE